MTLAKTHWDSICKMVFKKAFGNTFANALAIIAVVGS
jgi:hypothetical protein